MEYTQFEEITYCWPDGVATTTTVGMKVNEVTCTKIELSHDGQTVHIYWEDKNEGAENKYINCVNGLAYIAKKKNY